jgi:simple sugar transport system substrate-binding protein
VQGVIAGMMTKTNKICYVASYPIPEVIREINTYYLGAKKMNPDVELKITWVFTWYNPGKEADAAKAMIDQGCDMVAQHTDSPAPLIAAQDAGVHGFGQASDQVKFAPKAQLTATIDNWSPYYIAKVGALLDGTWETGTYFGDISECDATGCAVGMAPFTNLPQDVIDYVTDVRSQIAAGTYHAFTGPITDNEGKLQLADGVIADRAHIDSMMYYVEGIVGSIPK